VYVHHSSTETAPPKALYRVWVCAVGSCRRCIRRITRSVQVELDCCKLCVCVCVCVFFLGGGLLLFGVFSCASWLWKY